MSKRGRTPPPKVKVCVPFILMLLPSVNMRAGTMGSQ